MSRSDPLDEQKAIRLRQRLWGAAVLMALLVIFLPLLLDGSGSESQYRRVERLRAEPPRILDADGVPEPSLIAPSRPTQIIPEVLTEPVPPDNSTAVAQKSPTVEPQSRPEPTTANANTDQIQAWVVQAGSFGDEQNALAVRDRLRRAGFPSFVTPTEAATPLYRVRVGPMINLQQAEASRDKVIRLLDREAIVVSYP